MTSTIEIAGHRVGPGQPALVVAEMSANHGKDFGQAVRILEAAKEAGVDAVKLQTYTAETLTMSSERECFRIGGGTLWDGRTLYDVYSEGSMPWQWQPKLKKIADDLGILLFSTAFDPTAVEFLETIKVPVHKIASFEIVDTPLIEKMARTGKPLIISTGMAGLGEIDEAIQVARRAGATQIALLKCTSAYPAPPEEINLRTIPHLAEAFHLPVGLSDHTMGITIPVAAVSLGASIIEKHLTLSRSLPGPDSAFSLEPEELKEMVRSIRTAEKAVGEVRYGVSAIEVKSRVFRRSLFVVRDMEPGETFSEENVRSIRPGYGLAPKFIGEVLGRKAASRIEKGTPLAWSQVAGR